MKVQLTGISLAKYGLVHVTGLMAIGGIQGLNDPKFTDQVKPIIARESMCGQYHIDTTSIAVTDEGEVWIGSRDQMQLALVPPGGSATGEKSILEKLCSKGPVGGGYPFIGAMKPEDFFRRREEPMDGIILQGYGPEKDTDEPGPIAIVPPAGQALETGAGAPPVAAAA